METFLPTKAGLYVPADLARARQVWPNADWHLLDRAIRMLRRYDVGFQWRCEGADCPDRTMHSHTNINGERVLRCAHLDRVLSRTT